MKVIPLYSLLVPFWVSMLTLARHLDKLGAVPRRSPEWGLNEVSELRECIGTRVGLLHGNICRAGTALPVSPARYNLNQSFHLGVTLKGSR